MANSTLKQRPATGAPERAGLTGPAHLTLAQGLVRVGHQVDQETERHEAAARIQAGVGQAALLARDLGGHAVLVGAGVLHGLGIQGPARV